MQVAAVQADTDRVELTRLQKDVEGWLRDRGRAMIVLADSRAGRPQELLGPCIELAHRVLNRVPVARCLVEGGATASALLRGLQFPQLAVHCQYDPGVVGVRSAASPTEFIIKPGSYDWPEGLW
jgi:uncharacterized protein YgbK (DUF1537 family)